MQNILGDRENKGANPLRPTTTHSNLVEFCLSDPPMRDKLGGTVQPIECTAIED